MTENFLSPGRLWLLLVVAVVVAVYVGLQFRRSKYAVRISSLAMLDKVAPNRPGWRRHVVAGLYALGLAGLVLAYAQPVATEQVPRERSTIVVAIDTSLSMMATDVAPSRLEAAQVAATEFVQGLPEKLNVALIGFAGTAQLLVPPTQDRERVVQAIDSLDLEEATAIGDAIKLSVDVIDDQAQRTEEGLPDATVVLISDGETTVGLPTADAIPLAQDAGVAINTIAYGTPDGVITVDEDGDGVGQTAPVPVNTTELATVAEETGGVARTADSASDLEQVYADFGSTIGFDEEQSDIAYKFAGAALAVLTLGAGPRSGGSNDSPDGSLSGRGGLVAQHLGQSAVGRPGTNPQLFTLYLHERHRTDRQAPQLAVHRGIGTELLGQQATSSRVIQTNGHRIDGRVTATGGQVLVERCRVERTTRVAHEIGALARSRHGPDPHHVVVEADVGPADAGPAVHVQGGDHVVRVALEASLHLRRETRFGVEHSAPGRSEPSHAACVGHRIVARGDHLTSTTSAARSATTFDEPPGSIDTP
ncbi:MAG: VWA domain-containing protein [Microthrixaceae bacterium]